MKLLVERLGSTPTAFRFEAEPAWRERLRRSLGELEHDCVAPFRFELEAQRMGEDVYLEGTAHGLLELECVRCLARYRHALREAFRLLLEPAGPNTLLEPEASAALARDGMCLGDDLEAGWFRGKEIDLGDFLVEVIALALPVHPVCREDCRGLCPRCGIDRNQESCTCEATQPSSPFGALRTLRGRAGGES
jgi:uncharacterized protein